MRMSEASAKLHLRDHVRDDDVDRAIKVMLDSFLAAQKVSVQKALERTFRKYKNFGEDNNQLIMHQLQRRVREAEGYAVNVRGASAAALEVYVSELLRDVGELGIYDLRPFYASRVFRNHFRLDEQRGVISTLMAQ
jgi:DNA replication licensing factor MCM2